MRARVAWRGEGEMYRQVDTVDKTAVQRNIRASDIPRLAWWNGLTSGVKIKMGMRTGGESDGERCVREDVGEHKTWKQLRSDLQTYRLIMTRPAIQDISIKPVSQFTQNSRIWYDHLTWSQILTLGLTISYISPAYSRPQEPETSSSGLNSDRVTNVV